MIAVLDYDAGNLKSVETALRHLGASFEVGSDPRLLALADKIIFPGVGEASHAMSVLAEGRLGQALIDAIGGGVPTLGICLGCQIILATSDEGSTPCLALEKGRGRSFSTDFDQQNIHLKVPHIGWNQVCYREDHPASRLFSGIPQKSSFYFAHSYYPALDDPNLVMAVTDYGLEFTSAFGRNNLLACQFHPEKSGPVGLTLLDNFIRLF